MRVLSALVLTHCLGCIIPDDSDDDSVRKPPVSDHRNTGENSKGRIASSGRPVVSSADADDRRGRYDPGGVENLTTSNDEQASFMDIPALDRELSRYRRDRTSGLPQAQGGGFVCPLPRRSASVDTQENGNQVPRESAPLRLHSRHILAERHVRPERHSRDRNDTANRSLRSNGGYRLYREPTEAGRNNSKARDDGERVARDDDWAGDEDRAVEDTEETETDAGEWDEWLEWSECSASCGCGRQVRWRHCAGKGCMNGLKKAQIKTCHLRDCSSKNLLSWLGIKP